MNNNQEAYVIGRIYKLYKIPESETRNLIDFVRDSIQKSFFKHESDTKVPDMIRFIKVYSVTGTFTAQDKVNEIIECTLTIQDEEAINLIKNTLQNYYGYLIDKITLARLIYRYLSGSQFKQYNLTPFKQRVILALVLGVNEIGTIHIDKKTNTPKNHPINIHGSCNYLEVAVRPFVGPIVKKQVSKGKSQGNKKRVSRKLH